MKRAWQKLRRMTASLHTRAFYILPATRRVYRQMTIVDEKDNADHHLLFEEDQVPCDTCIIGYIADAYNIPRERLSIKEEYRCLRLRGGDVERIENS